MGAEPSEQKRVVACFCSLFFLVASYYLIKPLRNSQFLKEFLPENLPWVYLGVSSLSFIATKTFSAYYEKLNKARLLSATFIIICACKIAFFGGLMVGGKLVTVAFFLWGSIYFLLALAAIWGCINEIFRAEQGERCYGFIATGATMGCIAGSEISSRLTAIGPALLLISAVFMVLALLFILAARRLSDSAQPAVVEKKSLPSNGILAELLELWSSRYLRSIAVMVLCLAVYTTGIDFISQKQMDKRLAERQYMETLTSFNDELNRQISIRDPHQMNEKGFAFVYELRQSETAQVTSQVAKFASENHLAPEIASKLPAAYEDYRKELNNRTRKFFSDTFFYQGVCGIFVLTIVCRWLFLFVGIPRAVQLLPFFSLVAVLIFSVPLSLLTIQLLLVLGGTFNYSLNNATKEVLYTVTSTDAKYKIKPLIEGPVMRSGDMVASVVSLGCAATVHLLNWPTQYKDYLYLVFCSACVLVWLREISWAGREYERLRDVPPQ